MMTQASDAPRSSLAASDMLGAERTSGHPASVRAVTKLDLRSGSPQTTISMALDM